MTTLEILNALCELLREIPLDPVNSPDGEKLFEQVELAPNRDLADQLESLIITKARVCLVVPIGHRRTSKPEQGSGLSVDFRRITEVSLVYTDRAYFKPGQVVTFGGPKNLGLFAFDELIEQAVTAREISPFGGIIPGDSDPLTLTSAKRPDGREAWLMQLFVPTGLTIAAVC